MKNALLKLITKQNKSIWIKLKLMVNKLIIYFLLPHISHSQKNKEKLKFQNVWWKHMMKIKEKLVWLCLKNILKHKKKEKHNKNIKCSHFRFWSSWWKFVEDSWSLIATWCFEKHFAGSYSSFKSSLTIKQQIF